MSALRDIISAEIRAGGPISFARFMALALYHPQHGYYEQPDRTVGRSGDFYTSVSVGNLFGGLLAFRFAEWLAKLPGPVQVVEAGAHDGALAADILEWWQVNRPELFARVQYMLLEPSSTRREWQRARLARFGGRVQWHTDLAALRATSAGQSVRGTLFSNELLDALPVHRVGWDASKRHWFEWGVGAGPGGFEWARLATAPDAEVLGELARLPSELLAVLPDSYTVETGAAAQAWWREAAQALGTGWLVAFDYGATFTELLSPERTRGTLRAYRAHQVSDDVLAYPGEQDLTAHVNFTAVQQAGEGAGLTTLVFEEQERFLTRIAESAAQSPGGAEWLTKHHRQLQTLVHPGHLGRSFRVLVQERRA